MISQTLRFVLLRVMCTPLLWFCRDSPIKMVVALLILDFMDCDLKKVVNVIHGEEPGFCTNDLVYQVSDKVVDVLQYAVAIWLLCVYSYSYSSIVYVLTALLVWRIIGVREFILTKDTTHLVLFLDGIKEIILLHCLYNGVYFKEFAVLVCIGKICFEYLKNGKEKVK